MSNRGNPGFENAADDIEGRLLCGHNGSGTSAAAGGHLARRFEVCSTGKFRPAHAKGFADLAALPPLSREIVVRQDANCGAVEVIVLAAAQRP